MVEERQPPTSPSSFRCVPSLRFAPPNCLESPADKTYFWLGNVGVDIDYAQRADLRIATDSVKSACQQACPADAIEFGDLANKESKVVKMKELPRSYDMLGYLGVRPRTSFLGRIKNPNGKMPGGEHVGKVARGAAH